MQMCCPATCLHPRAQGPLAVHCHLRAGVARQRRRLHALRQAVEAPLACTAAAAKSADGASCTWLERRQTCVNSTGDPSLATINSQHPKASQASGLAPHLHSCSCRFCTARSAA